MNDQGSPIDRSKKRHWSSLSLPTPSPTPTLGAGLVSKRSPRYSKKSKSLNGEGLQSHTVAKSITETIRPLATMAIEANYARQWHHTKLGSEMASNKNGIHRNDTAFTIMSYNVLADHLAQRHPELYDTGNLNKLVFNLN
jgi:hypothetical protein